MRSLLNELFQIRFLRNGRIEYDEFREVMAYNAMYNELSPEKEQEMLKSFRDFDVDENGYISATDLYLCMHMLGVELSVREVEELFEVVDVDGDGQVQFCFISRLIHIVNIIIVATVTISLFIFLQTHLPLITLSRVDKLQ